MIKHRGVTLVEILIVGAIVLLLGGLIYPVFILAKQSAAVAPDTAKMRQIGVALALYTEGEGGMPTGLDPLVERGLVTKELLVSETDPFRGYGGKVATCRGRAPKYPTSYDHLLGTNSSTRAAFEQADPNVGSVALRTHGTKTAFMQRMRGQFCPNSQFLYSGLVLRLAKDGSVQKRTVSIFDGAVNGRARWRLAPLFVDNWEKLPEVWH